MNSSRQKQHVGNGKKQQVMLGVACSKTSKDSIFVLLIMLGKRLYLIYNEKVATLK
jgi:hypothetical protein